jgi:hypothetical protein
VINIFFTRTFDRVLLALDMTGAPVHPATRNTTSLAERAAGWFTRSGSERAAFAFTWQLTGRDLTYKMRTYPSIGYSLVVFMGNIFAGEKSWIEHPDTIATSPTYLFIIYLFAFYLSMFLTEVSSSSDSQAAWIYQALPIDLPGPLLAGTFKAILTKFFIPFYLLVSLPILAVWGSAAFGNLLLGLVNNILLGLALVLITGRKMPFARDAASSMDRTAMAAKMLLIGLIVAAVGLIHYGLSQLPFAVWVAIPVQILIAWVLYQTLIHLQWHQVSGL